MQEIIVGLQNAFFQFNTDGKYMALFIAAMFLLLIWNRDKDKKIMLYVLLTTACILFPVFWKIFLRIFPGQRDYYRMFYLLPIPFVIAYAAIELVDREKAKRQIVIGLLVILILCGHMNPFRSITGKRENPYAITNVNLEVLSLLPKEELSLLSSDDLMTSARRYRSDILLPYGEDLWNGAINVRTMDLYQEEEYNLHEWLQDPANNIDYIFKYATNNEYEYIIFQKYIVENVSVASYGYQEEGQTDQFVLLKKE